MRTALFRYIECLGFHSALKSLNGFDLRSSLSRLVVLAFAVSNITLAQVSTKRIVPVRAAEAEPFKDADTVGVALLVGIGKYPKFSGLAELHYPERDVDLLAASLKKQRYIVVTLKDSEATKGAVLNAIQQAGEALSGENLSFLFFFSGHGFEAGRENYLATLDATANNLSATGLSVRSVEEALEATKAPRRVMWLDACRDEPGKGVGEARSFASLEASAGTRALLSTKAGKVSYEDDQLKQGIFSYYLVKGLEGDAAGPDGLVTFHDLATYVTARVRARSLETGHVQVPYEGPYEATGDFLLAKVGNTGGASAAGVAPVAPKEEPRGSEQTTGPDNAQTTAAIDQKFISWGASWAMDRYVGGSAHIDEMKCQSSGCTADGTFSFIRMGARHQISFQASIVPAGTDRYSLGRLCYTDNTTNMRDCTN